MGINFNLLLYFVTPGIGTCLTPVFPVLQLDVFYNKPFDIISTNFEEFKDDSALICVTMLNVTEDVAMIFHTEDLLHLLKLVVIPFLRLF